MVVIVAAERAAAALELLRAHGEGAQLIGEVRAGARGVHIRE
jgi:phosphoribosylaminoimidazole (AIR) synthetase